MSTATQQTTYTTGLNVTATILNSEFGNIITHLNSIYGLIDDTSGAGVLTIDTTNNYLGINYATPETGLDVVQGKTVESVTNVVARYRASTSAAADAGVLIGVTNGNAPFITDASGGGTSIGMRYASSTGDVSLAPAANGDIVEIEKMPRKNHSSNTYVDSHTQSGWTYKNGTGSTFMSISVTFTVPFSSNNVDIGINYLGIKVGSDPSNQGDVVGGSGIWVNATNITATGFDLFFASTASLTAGNRYMASWIAVGPT